jgi:hypothetical protein
MILMISAIFSLISKIRVAVLMALWLSVIGVAAVAAEKNSEPTKPLSEGAQAESTQSEEPRSDFVLRLGNESNQNDGKFGPLTYGIRANHTFDDRSAFEAGYILLHEPGTPRNSSVLDEAQLTFKFSETHFFNQPITFAATAWKNRTIDMYTELGGLQLTRKGDLSFNAGVYGGRATLDDLSGRFIGFEAGISGTLGPFEIAFDHINGRIDTDGIYQKSALEAASDISFSKNIPLTLIFSLEDRYFNLGDGRPASQSSDELIFVTSFEIHFGPSLQ